MEILWTRGRASVRDVLAALSAQREIAYTTVMTVMTRLWEQGILAREREGKTYLYRPAQTREQFRAVVSGAIVDDLVADFGDVALAHFVAALERADPARLARLRALAGEGAPADDDT
jgi:predicted transcriptional regulator